RAAVHRTVAAGGVNAGAEVGSYTDRGVATPVLTRLGSHPGAVQLPDYDVALVTGGHAMTSTDTESAAEATKGTPLCLAVRVRGGRLAFTAELASLLAQIGPLPPAQAVNIIAQMASALAAATRPTNTAINSSAGAVPIAALTFVRTTTAIMTGTH
ncbi:MAG: hypothetical protein LC808_44880, partial [Actinobacteria bacterium]|nr:hypothetical protein [Actinomycetota bacterium]